MPGDVLMKHCVLTHFRCVCIYSLTCAGVQLGGGVLEEMMRGSRTGKCFRNILMGQTLQKQGLVTE